MKLQVVESKTWRWYFAVVIALIAAMSLSAWYAWDLSKVVRADLQRQLTTLRETDDKLTKILLKKERLLTELDRSVQMSRANVSEVSITLTKLQEDKTQLEKELSFYRSIMAPEMDKSGLTINDILITPLLPSGMDNGNDSRVDNNAKEKAAKSYEFELVLTQVKKQDWYIKGRYQIWLITKSETNLVEKRISLLKFVKKANFKAKFSFRYFQTFRESFKIPADLQPTAIVVTATTRDGKQKVTRRFPWPSEEKTADVQ